MSKSTIHGKGPFRYEEAIAGAAGIYPGMLLKLNSSGEVVVHATAGGYAEAAFAQEDVLNEGHDVLTVYEDDALVGYLLPSKGSTVNALIADGEDIAIGDQLCSDGLGYLVKVVASEVPIAVAEEALDLTASANAAGGLCAVRIM